MQIEKPKVGTPLKGWLIGLLAVAILAWGTRAYFFSHKDSLPQLPFLSQAPQVSTLPPLEIANFTGKPETYSKKDKKWLPLERGTTFEPGGRIRTDEKSEIELRAENQVMLRLKNNSELERKPILRRAKTESYRLYLIRGLILGATERKAEIEKWLEVSTPAIVAAIRGTVFAVSAEGPAKKSWVGVLRGTVEVSTPNKAENIAVHDLQKIETNPDGTLGKAIRISQNEWNEMKEAYELIQKSAAEEAEQMDLSQAAGGLFDNVFDHGTFFTPKVGYAWRNFEKNSEGKIILSVEYDVFPRGSFVGMYLKMRDMNLANYDALQLKVARVPETGYPEAFKIEIKSKGQVMRTFTPKTFKKEWQTMQFPFRATKDIPVSEITFVFSNEKSGEFTRGALRFSDIKLVPKPPAEKEPAKPAPALKPAPPAAAPASPAPAKNAVVQKSESKPAAASQPQPSKT